MRKHEHSYPTLLRTLLTKPLIWVAIIILLGSFIRLYRFADFMEIQSDHARDILIAKHIVEYTEGAGAAPYALGSGGNVKNSPLYYWILAGMWSISRSAVGMGIAFAVTGVLMVWIGYAAGAAMGGSRLGLVFAFFLSISSFLSRSARAVWPPNLLPVVTVTSLYFMVRLSRDHRPVWLAGYITSLFLGMHIHQSFLPFFAAGMIWAAYQSLRKFSHTLLFIALAVLHAAFWMYVTGNGAGTFRAYAHIVSSGTHVSEVFSTAVQRIVQSITALFIGYPEPLGYVFLAISFVLFAQLVHKKGRKEHFVIIATLSAGMFAYGLYGNDTAIAFRDYYLRAASTVFLFILSLLAATSIRNNAALTVFALITGALIGTDNIRYLQQSNAGNYYDHLRVIHLVLEDYRGNGGIRDGSIVFYTRYMSAPADSWRYIWSAAPEWYLLEETLGRKIITIPDGYNNFPAPVIRDDSTVYLTCVNDTKNTGDEDMAFRTLCLEPFISGYGNMLSAHHVTHEFMFNASSGDVFRVYRYSPTRINGHTQHSSTPTDGGNSH